MSLKLHGGAAEAVHHGDSDAVFGEGFGDDFVDAEVIEGAEDVEEADGGFGELAFAGAEHHDFDPVGEVDVAVFGFATVAHEGVAFVGIRDEVGGRFEEAEGGLGGIVGGELAGGFGGFVDDTAGEGLHLAVEFEVFGGDGSGAEDGDGGFGGAGFDFDDGGFETVHGGAGVDDEGDASVEFCLDGGGGGGADAAEAVGAGGGDGASEALGDFFEEAVGADTDGNGGESGGDEVGDDVFFGEDDGEGAGPEAVGDFLEDGVDVSGDVSDHGEVFFVREMDDEGIEGGAFFGFEDFGDGGGVEGVGGEAVDGFGGQGDDFTCLEEPDGFGDGFFGVRVGDEFGGDDAGFHG